MRVSAFGVLLLALLFPSSSPAQYIYLDSNGDGVHTSADVLHEVGQTVVDIWLDIGHNRDGSPTVCRNSTGISSRPLDMFSYEVSIKAAGGTVAYSGYTNRIAEMGVIGPPHAPDGIQFATGFWGYPGVGALAAGGRYLLGTFTVSVTSGAPSLDFVTFELWPDTPFVEYTLFGSHCEGTSFPNSMVFGTNWSDADGLPFGTGGMSDQAPSLTALENMLVQSGDNATQALTATDADGQPLTFTKVSGPGFMLVQTLDVGSGHAAGEIRLSPVASDAGTSTGKVKVSDGDTSDQRSFTITVASSPGHPPVLSDIPGLSVIAGTVGQRFLTAGDPDGGSLQFSKVSGAPFLHLKPLASRSGGASAILRVSPTLCEVGDATGRIAISDGVTESVKDVVVKVLAPSSLPDDLIHTTPNGGRTSGIAIGDLDRDGKQDAVVIYENLSRVSVLRGSGDGTFQPAVSYDTGSGSFALVLSDFDRNGAPDVAVANESVGSVSVLLGHGDGTLLPAVAYPVGAGPADIAAADMNLDGIPDLVTTNQASSTVSVLLGHGDGTFQPSRESDSGPSPASLVVADFDLDGRPDVALANQVPGSYGSRISILPGSGDGTFRQPISTPLSSFPISLVTADWNSDGIPDLALTDAFTLSVKTLVGRGDGTLAPPSTVASFFYPYGAVAEDLDGDGNMDLVVGDVDRRGLVVLQGTGNGGFRPPVLLPGMSPTLAVGDLNSDGRPDFASTEGSLGVITRFNRFSAPNPSAQAKAFVQGEKRNIPAAEGRGDICVLIEPVNHSYEAGDLDVTSLRMTSEGTGSVSEIHSVPSRRLVESDRDRDGVPEVGVFFARADLGHLFDQLRGRNTVFVSLTGSLTDGRSFCSGVELNVLGTPHTEQAAAFAPNPLNPRTKLTFVTDRDGPANARLFDIHGRLVRTLLDTARLPAGAHEYTFDGKGDQGASLSSGVYFYRVETPSETSQGQIVILK